MTLLRRSPITFPYAPLRTEGRDGWMVCLEFENQGQGPYITDLSHARKWDVQSSELSAYRPGGATIPEKPGLSVLQDGWLVNRLNHTQASVWQLAPGAGTDPPDPAAQPAYTETTDAQALLALIGNEHEVENLLESLTAMDLFGPAVTPPMLFQGTVLHVPSQVVRLGTRKDREAVLIACSRGYGQSMADAILAAGRPYGIAVGGEEVFSGILRPKFLAEKPLTD